MRAARVTVCVCFGVKHQKEFGINVRMKKENWVRGVCQVSHEQPLAICAKVGMATVLTYARVTHHGT